MGKAKGWHLLLPLPAPPRLGSRTSPWCAPSCCPHHVHTPTCVHSTTTHTCMHLHTGPHIYACTQTCTHTHMHTLANCRA